MIDLAVFLMDLDGGGAERVMLNLARGFADRGLKVDLVLVKAEGPYLSQLPDRVRVVELESSRLIFSVTALAKYLKQERPKTLIAALEDTNLVAIWAQKLARVPTQIVVTVHNHLTRDAQNATQLKRKLAPVLAKLFYPWADRIVAVSQGVAKNLRELGFPSAKITYIYNPIVTPELRELDERTIAHFFEDDLQIPVILGVGRLEKQKDFPTLIRAFAEVRKQQLARLLILGEGSQKTELEFLVAELGLQEDVTFGGFVANPYAYMKQASVVVLSSAWEGFGNILVEAMFVGTPVVSTNCESGPTEILQNGEYGTIVDVGDIKAMATAIRETLNSDRDADKLKTRANEFSLEAALDRYQEIFTLQPDLTVEKRLIASLQQQKIKSYQ
jgi:glycosyltransferase involved in cell wall biosynthesis